MNYTETNETAARVAAIRHKAMAETITNNERRSLHCDIEYVLISIESALHKLRKTGKTEDPDLLLLKSELISISESKTKLQRVVRSSEANFALRILEFLDASLRLLSVWLWLVVTAILLAFPCMILRPLDFVLVRLGIIPPTYQISNLCKRFIAGTFLKLAGVHIVVDSEASDLWGKESALICFTHASSLDAFLLAFIIPVKHYSLAKSDLFLLPFFSWSLLAFGGLPVNRDNRDQAIKSVSKAAKLAKLGDCVAVAPEGTRSLTGQLLPFKKGPFYLWETLQNPIVPMVTFGAYDLCPPGSNIPVRGVIHVKLLKPIYPSEAANREEMSLLVRRRMLDCIAASPEDTAAELTWWQRIESLLYLVLFYAVTGSIITCLWLYVSLKEALLFIGFQNGWLAALMLLSASIVITVLVYIWVMYVTYWLEDLVAWLWCDFACGQNSNRYSRLDSDDAESRSLVGSNKGPGSYGTRTTANGETQL